MEVFWNRKKSIYVYYNRSLNNFFLRVDFEGEKREVFLSPFNFFCWNAQPSENNHFDDRINDFHSENWM